MPSHETRPVRLLARVASFVLASALAADALSADRVITHDNRIISVKKAREKDGGYVLQFEHGEITIPDKAAVKAVEIEGNMADYVPADDDEKSKLEQGYVKYRGKWLSKKAYEDELEKEAAASKRRADEIAAHTEFHSGWTKETKHFRFQTNTSPELLEYYAELLETYYDLMDKRFDIKTNPVLGRTKMNVHVFKSHKDFLDIAQPDSSSVLGYFDRANQVLKFFHNYDEPAQSEWVALHECTHLLTYLIDPQYYAQIWLNEAVADYFGSSEISRDKKGKLVIRPGALQADRLLTVQNAIKDGNDTKLDKLFDLTRDEFDGFQYAHAWAFIYFLNETGAGYQKGFDKFFKNLYTQAKGITYETISVSAGFDKSGMAKQAPPAEIRRVVLESIKVKDLDALEKEWKTWIAAIELKGAEERFKRAYQSVAFGRLLEIKNDRIDRNATLKNAEIALADVDAALAAGLSDPRAHWTRYRVLRILNKPEEAKQAIEAAVAADPLNARYRWDLGQMLHSGSLGGIEFAFGGFSIQGGSAPSDEALNSFRLATELAPENENYREALKKLTDA
jgi:hypothetical protein